MFLPEQLRRGPLTLRLWEPDDASALATCVWQNRHRLARFMPWVAEEPMTRARRLELIRRWRADFEAGMDATYGTWLDGRVVGGCGLHQRLGPGGLEIGYWVAQDAARRRVAATTAALLTQAALDAEGVDRVEIHHAVENAASSGVPRLLGYHRLGEVLTEPAVPGLSGRHVIWRLATGDLDDRRREQLRGIAVSEAPGVPTGHGQGT